MLRLRSAFLLGLCLTLSAQAETYKTIEWTDLIPADAKQDVKTGTVQHDQISTDFQAPAIVPVVQSLNKQKIKMAGFAVPLEGNDNGITEFLLVPYMGACIHVPPPPANQIVYVRAEKPLPVDLIYDAFWVKGTMKVGTVSSQYTDAGYSLSGEGFEAYQYQ